MKLYSAVMVSEYFRKVFPIPIEFVRLEIEPTWGEALWAIENGYIHEHDIKKLAWDKSAESSSAYIAYINDLCFAQTLDRYTILEILKALSKDKLIGNEFIEHFVTVGLGWILKNWDRYENPSGAIESYLASVDYPKYLSDLNSAVAGQLGAPRDSDERYQEVDQAIYDLAMSYMPSRLTTEITGAQ